MRLTQAVKESIVRNAVEKAGFTKRKEELDKRKKELAEDIRIDSLGGVEKAKEIDEIINKIFEMQSKLPEDLQNFYIPVDSLISCNIAGQRYRMYCENYKPTPYKHTLTADHPLAIKWNQYINDREDFERERDKLKADVMASMSQVSTVKQLLRVWPEAVELIPKEEAKVVLPPAISVKDLNKAIGLPSKK